MPFSKNINTYNDVVQILTAARAAGMPVRYELSSPGAAMNWVQRVFYYRKLLTNAARARAGNVAGFIPTTAWDDIVLNRVGNVITITFGKVKGRLTLENGEEVAVLPVVTSTLGEAEQIIRDVAPPRRKQGQTEDPDFIVDLNVDDLERAAANLVAEKGAK